MALPETDYTLFIYDFSLLLMYHYPLPYWGVIDTTHVREGAFWITMRCCSGRQGRTAPPRYSRAKKWREKGMEK